MLPLLSAVASEDGNYLPSVPSRWSWPPQPAILLVRSARPCSVRYLACLWLCRRLRPFAPTFLALRFFSTTLSARYVYTVSVSLHVSGPDLRLPCMTSHLRTPPVYFTCKLLRARSALHHLLHSTYPFRPACPDLREPFCLFFFRYFDTFCFHFFSSSSSSSASCPDTAALGLLPWRLRVPCSSRPLSSSRRLLSFFRLPTLSASISVTLFLCSALPSACSASATASVAFLLLALFLDLCRRSLFVRTPVLHL